MVFEKMPYSFLFLFFYNYGSENVKKMQFMCIENENVIVFQSKAYRNKEYIYLRNSYFSNINVFCSNYLCVSKML